MARPDRPSSIDRLPDTVKAAIGRLRLQGRTIDEILAHLEAMDVEVSRSALGRHVKGLAALTERRRMSRDMATALADRFGDAPDNQLQRLNIELMHGIILQTLTATEEDEDGESRPVTFGPQEAKFLAEALAKLTSAEKTEADRVLKVKAEAKKEAVQAVEKVAKSEGISRETIDRIKADILGIGA